MTTSRDHSLRVLLDPQSIAIIGASDNPDKIGGRPIRYLSQFGYRGRILPINPHRNETQNLRSYPDLDALPEAPEVAIIAVASDAAVKAVAECAEKGVRAAVVMSSGFGETNDVDSRNKELAMVAAARAHGMRVVGPNSQGLANFGNGAILSFSTMFLETTPADGPVGIISQSGAMSVVPYGLLRQRGIGVRYTHATGNDADVTTLELAAAVAEDPDLKVLLLYLEGIPDPEHLEEAARIAARRNLPVIALKSGRTPAGQRAARSHTGALANEDRVVDAFFERCGIWRARDVQDMVHAVELHLKGWRPKGRRLVAISNSGAACVLTADAASMAGMPLATLSEETRKDLGQILPSFATTANPVDITAALLTNSGLFSEILPVIARDPAADAFLIGVPVAGKGYDVDAFARDAAAFARETGKPLVSAIPQPGVAARFLAHGLSVYPTESEAIAALNQYLSHVERMQAARPRLLAEAEQPRVRGNHGAAEYSATERLLNEADSLALGTRFGIRCAPYRLCRTPEDAVQALRELDGPVAVKGCSADIAHKSELGIVRLGVSTEGEVRAAFAEIERRIAEADAQFDGVIVARMFKGRHEFLIGAHIDPVFGPVVVVGDGGKYVEALPDTQLLLPPFTADDVRLALSRLRIAPLFDGVRGEPPLDIPALVDAVLTVGGMMASREANVVSADFNPVIVGAAGQGVAAVDALITVRDGQASRNSFLIKRQRTIMKQKIRIGSGAAWWGDRVEPAVLNADKGDLDYLCFETMAEATVSAAQVRARRDPGFPGYDTYLDDRMKGVLPGCLKRGTKIISNQGWINPNAAAERIAYWLRQYGAKGRTVAAVSGSLITERALELTDTILENGKATSTLRDSMVSAEAYMGAEPIVEALKNGATIVVTGRVADPSIFMAPMMYEFGWDPLDHVRVGAGNGIGHLLECGAQVTGGYFSDPGFKDVPEPWNLAFPIAEVEPDGSAVITKVAGTGGAVNLQTVKEQLLYEVHDPANYLTPDVVVDFTTSRLEQVGPDRVRVTGISGKPRTPTLKASIGCAEGYIGEDMFFYAGPGALRRAQLATKILEERFRMVGLKAEEVRIDFLGVNAIHGAMSPTDRPEPYEVAVRVAARTKTREEALKVGREVDGMAVSGIAATGKRVPFQERVREVIGVWSSLIPREHVVPEIKYFEV